MKSHNPVYRKKAVEAFKNGDIKQSLLFKHLVINEPLA